MKEQTKNTFLAVVVGAVAGAGLLVGISSVVSASLNPLVFQIDRLADKVSLLDQKLVALEEAIRSVKSQPAGRSPQPPKPAPEDTTVYDIPVGDSYILGNAEAPVTIVEFSDLECPYCSRFHASLMEAAAAFPDKVRIIFKNYPLPFHPNARPAAKAALAAGVQGKYFEMIGLILGNQAGMSDAKYLEYAGQLGLNVEQFSRDLKERDAEWEARIKADEALVPQLKVPGTPSYFLNGKKTSARTLDTWKEAIVAAMKAGNVR